MKTKDIVIAVFVIALIGLLGYLWMAPSGVKPAPAVAMTTLKGEELKLESLKGRPVIVNFWATSCPGCIKEMPYFIELYNKYQSQGLVMVGVAMSYDPEKQVRNMVKEKGISYPIVLDTTGELAKLFGDVRLTPTTFFISPNGTIVRQQLGEISRSSLEAMIQSLFSQKA